MVDSDPYGAFLSRIEEARLYSDQGLADIAADVLQGISAELEASDLDDDQKERLQSRILADLQGLQAIGATIEAGPEPAPRETPEDSASPDQVFDYGRVLMDSHAWEEAIKLFKKAAAIGYRTIECWELCGDCAVHLEKWQEAIRYFEIVYTDPTITSVLKQKILHKITKCSQKRKQIEAQTVLKARTDAAKGGETKARAKSRSAPSLATPLDGSTISQLFGQSLQSWKNERGEYLVAQPRSYRVCNLLQIGSTSLIVELEVEGTGERLAGQAINGAFTNAQTPAALARWTYDQLMTESWNLARVFDLAHNGDFFFIVREYLPLSLADLLSGKNLLPLPFAIFLGYQILEGIGDLHLRMGRDKQIRSLFHLDLRPSRIVLHNERPIIKIYNGGLWKELEGCNARGTSVQRLPLPFLAYRAPEQFRPYLARRRPPVFTDIYLFGIIFFEMLTGNPAFRASSFEEYEIQHCEQYPSSPKMWRPDIPDELNDMIMTCLERDPMKRWRSTTQMSLILEKVFSQQLQSTPREGAYARYITEILPA